MRTFVIGLSAAGLLAGGITASALTLVSHSGQATRGLVCAQPTNPTAREIVNDVCKVFGP